MSFSIVTDDIMNFLEMFMGSLKVKKEKVDENIGVSVIIIASGFELQLLTIHIIIIIAKNSHFYASGGNPSTNRMDNSKI